MKRIGFVLIVAAVAALGLALYVFAVAASSPSRTQRIDDTARNYASTTMVWNKGPSVQSTQIIPLGHLAAALRHSVSPGVATDVNVPDLIHRFGAKRQVGLVVLTGTFNTLPPDEGVTVHGQAVVLVDVVRNRALYLMD